MEIKNSTALVTGGASGLGWAVAEKFLQKGGKVLILDWAEEPEGLKKYPDTIFFKGDVSSGEQVAQALQKLKEKFGGLHIAVNCAGIAVAIKTLHSGGPHDLESFSKTVQVNLIGTFNVCRLAAEAMATHEPNDDGERGVLINTASIAAFEGQMGQIAYAASKGGIVSMTLPMARDLAKFGIRVNTIAPGLFDTPLLAKLPEPARKALGDQVPFPHRLGRPCEFAALAEHVVENPMLNGEVIRLDGALRMGIK